MYLTISRQPLFESRQPFQEIFHFSDHGSKHGHSAHSVPTIPCKCTKCPQKRENSLHKM
jgi:hypothetical protein